MRVLIFFPLLCTTIALILAFLAIFAGTNHDMMEGYDMLTLNTSRIGANFLNSTKPSPTTSTSQPTSTSFLGSLIHNATAEIHNATGHAEQDIENDLNKVFLSIAKDLGLKDFYSVHVLNHCEGYFNPNGSSHRNVTLCSNSTNGLSTFNATATLQRELNASHVNITLAELHWPQAITDAENSLKLAFNVSFVFMCIGLIFTGLALLACAVGLFTEGRLSALVNIALAWLAFFTLALASIITTVGASKITDAINKYGAEINVNAARGNKFIALNWAGTALMAVAGLAWMGDCLMGRRKRKSSQSVSWTVASPR